MDAEFPSPSYQALASYRRCVEGIATSWPRFLDIRADRLRHGGETEKVAEAILEDLLTGVLDWSEGDLAYGVGFADIVLSKNLAKYLVIEVKRPGTLFMGRQALAAALEQARRYADEQRVTRIAASDGCYFYAADLQNGVLKDRIMVDLAQPVSPEALWWISVHGIYRPCEHVVEWPAEPTANAEAAAPISPARDKLLHPKYKLPASCFGYVGDANKPTTWKLPYLEADGSVNEKRLPKAVQALLSNYRGTKVGGIPEQAIPAVLANLARAADSIGRMPPRAINPAPVYQQLAAVLAQLQPSSKDATS